MLRRVLPLFAQQRAQISARLTCRAITMSHSTTALLCTHRSQSSSHNDNDNELLGAAFDPTASIAREAAAQQAEHVRDRLLREWLPADAPDAARNKLRKSLSDFPVDGMITAPQVKITHVEDEAGVEQGMKLDAVDRDEALEQARFREMNLVQMAERGGVAFCRIRNEKKRMLKVLEPELGGSGEEAEAAQAASSSVKLKAGIDHNFRDVVDAHFISWKSKKIAQDIRKMHPIKLGIQEFQTADSAIAKMREMCNAIKAYAEENKIYHHYTSVHATDRELSVTLSPSIQGQKNSSTTVKHPGEKEWSHALGRMGGALRASGRMGTYSKYQELKPRNMGAQPFRVDKYGRKID